MKWILYKYIINMVHIISGTIINRFRNGLIKSHIYNDIINELVIYINLSIYNIFSDSLQLTLLEISDSFFVLEQKKH